MSNSSSNGCTSGSNSSTSGNSSPVAPDLSPQIEVTQPKEETKTIKTEPGMVVTTSSANNSGSKGKVAESVNKSKTEPAVKIKTEVEEEIPSKPSLAETRNTAVYHKEETNTVELHPRKRKLKSKQESAHSEPEHLTSFSATPHPHEVPVTNCYQMFMDIRKQVSELLCT